MFKSWEELTPLEQAHEIYSDMHKDAYGFRPRNDVRDWTLEDFEATFAILQKVIKEDMEREEAEQQQAVTLFEQQVAATIAAGARDRETALRWIMQSSDADGDWEYFCFLNNLPYGYFKSLN